MSHARLRTWSGALAASGLLALGAARAASVHLYSYDPANAETRHVAGQLTFEFRKSLLHATMLNIRATTAEATAWLEPVGDKVLGPHGLSPLVGSAPERDLYEILPVDQGPALISAFCPGARHAWVSVGQPRYGRDLRMFVLGDSATGGPMRRCQTLDFNFHGEWSGPIKVPTLTERQLESPRFPAS